ncbi:MAG: hypothetical protein JXD21_01550 [Candidatus Omnitrophica bacterium]|nr:hypothetical protein [Candidatus Omnitrophota bacterium]
MKDKMNMPTISSVNQDYVVSYLRCQVTTLGDLLDAIERGAHPEYRYLIESIRRVEVDLRRLRNFIEN